MINLKETPNSSQNMATPRNYRIIYYKFINQFNQCTVTFSVEKTGKNESETSEFKNQHKGNHSATAESLPDNQEYLSAIAESLNQLPDTHSAVAECLNQNSGRLSAIAERLNSTFGNYSSNKNNFIILIN